MKGLLVGDPHATPATQAEVCRMIRWAGALAQQSGCSFIALMGDLHDKHGVERVEMLHMWRSLILHLRDVNKLDVLIATGNHDMDQDCRFSWTEAYAEIATVALPGECIPVPKTNNLIWMAPFFRTSDHFYSAACDAARKGGRFLLCHQEFKNCKMDNGWYSPHGFDLANAPKELFMISGHIHTAQTMTTDDRVAAYYVGAPRQINRNDIGRVPTVVTVDFAGYPAQFETYEVPEEVVSRFVHAELREGSSELVVKDPSKTYVDVYGTKDFVKKTLAKLPPGVKVRSHVDRQQAQVRLRESEGLATSFGKYFESFSAAKQLDEAKKAQLAATVKELCPGLYK